MPRTLIIGLDGASPHLIQRWREHLPNLDALMQRGASGVLESVIPPRSVPAWYCFATGMNPAKLGVFGFSQRLPGTYDYTFANLSFCRRPTFWQWLNQHGARTAIVHVPGTFPPHPVDGVLVSGWPAPLNRSNLTYTHPPELSRAIDRRLGRPFEFLSELPMRVDNEAEVLADRLRILDMHGDVAEFVLAEHDWDVGLVVFSPLDRASHQFWRHLDPTHPAHDPTLAAALGDALLAVYQRSDTQVGRLLDLLDTDDTVFVVSDHGFGPARRTFYLNEWLHRANYLVLQDGTTAGAVSWRSALLGRLAAPLFWLNRVSPAFRRLADPLKKRALSNLLRREYVRTKDHGLLRVNHLPVDWSRTSAYCPDEASLYLNLRGRDPQGVVAPGTEADRLLSEIESGLRQLRDPQTGEPVSLRTYRKDDIYHGPFMDAAPELIVEMDDYATQVMAELGSATLCEPTAERSGTHTREGVLIAAGPGIRPGAALSAGLMDVAPTVLHLMGSPVPAESDGQVLVDLFEADADARRRPIETATLAAAGAGGETVYSDAELSQIEQQLRDLGYMG